MEDWALVILLTVLSLASYSVGAARSYIVGYRDGRRSAENERIGK